MLSFPFVISLFLLYSLAAAHTEQFTIVKRLADEAGVKLDLTGKQSYAIYELCTRQNELKGCIPCSYHMRLINGNVKCEDENNCNFVGYAFDVTINPQHAKSTIQVSKQRPWIPNHYYDKEAQSYVRLSKSNRYKWAGPTKELNFQEIHSIGMCIIL
ncbi:hypothetical protein PspLS_02550 [Pyricularia sp. CBS 133598]|nr:hypothetical protein PspLS_02550 [Pyricularia sp. CBS 133598]